MQKKYFIYNDKIYYGSVLSFKTHENGTTTYTFHRPNSKMLQDDVTIFSLYVADDVETLKRNIVERARGLQYLNKDHH